MGFFFRTLRMVDHGIKPMYVFDGKPPDLKGGVVSIGSTVYPHRKTGRRGEMLNLTSSYFLFGRTVGKTFRYEERGCGS
jgi:hypothetical protein